MQSLAEDLQMFCENGQGNVANAKSYNVISDHFFAIPQDQVLKAYSYWFFHQRRCFASFSYSVGLARYQHITSNITQYVSEHFFVPTAVGEPPAE